MASFHRQNGREVLSLSLRTYRGIDVWIYAILLCRCRLPKQDVHSIMGWKAVSNIRYERFFKRRRSTRIPLMRNIINPRYFRAVVDLYSFYLRMQRSWHPNGFVIQNGNLASSLRESPVCTHTLLSLVKYDDIYTALTLRARQQAQQHLSLGIILGQRSSCALGYSRSDILVYLELPFYGKY